MSIRKDVTKSTATTTDNHHSSASKQHDADHAKNAFAVSGTSPTNGTSQSAPATPTPDTTPVETPAAQRPITPTTSKFAPPVATKPAKAVAAAAHANGNGTAQATKDLRSQIIGEGPAPTPKYIENACKWHEGASAGLVISGGSLHEKICLTASDLEKAIEWMLDASMLKEISRDCYEVIKAAPVKEVDPAEAAKDDPWLRNFDRAYGKDLRWIVQPKSFRHTDGWLPIGSVSLCIGASGAGKTTWILDFIKKLDGVQTVYGRKTMNVQTAIVSYDRSRRDLIETCRSMRINPNSLNFFDVRGAWWSLSTAEVLWRLCTGDFEGLTLPDEAKEQLAARFQDTQLFIVEGIDMKVPNGKIADNGVVGTYLQEITEAAQKHDFAVLGVTGSPKMKPDDRYTATRDLAIGASAWGRKCHTMISIVSKDAENPDDSTRILTVLPRAGAPDKRELTWKNGRFIEVETKKPAKAAKPSKVNEIIAYIEATYKVGVPFAPANLRKANPNWGDQTIQDACKKLVESERLGARENGVRYRTGGEYVKAVAQFVESRENDAPFTASEFAQAVKTRAVDHGDDLIERLFRFQPHTDSGRLIGHWSRLTLEKLADRRYRRWKT